MAKIGTIAWHEEQIKKKRAAYKAGNKKAVKTKQQNSEGSDYVYKKKSKKPKPRFVSRVEFDFLKYIRVVFKWAKDNSGLGRPQIELLLYLYGLGAFSKRQFSEYYRLIGIYQQKGLQDMIDDGWIRLWRAKKGKEHALYTLTVKGKHLCNAMHRYCAGVSDIPIIASQNKMAREDAPRVNNYFLDIVKRMNKDKAPD